MKKSIPLFILGIFYSIQLFSHPYNLQYKDTWVELFQSQQAAVLFDYKHCEKTKENGVLSGNSAAIIRGTKALRYALKNNIEDYFINEALLKKIYLDYIGASGQAEEVTFRSRPVAIDIIMPCEDSNFYSEIAKIFEKNGVRIVEFPPNKNIFAYLRELAEQFNIKRVEGQSLTEKVINEHHQVAKFPKILWNPEDGKAESNIKHSIVSCSADKISDKLNAIFENYNNQIKTQKTEQENLDLILQTIQSIMLVSPFKELHLQPYIILMQRLLLQNGLFPIVLKERRQFQYYPPRHLLRMYDEGKQLVKQNTCNVTVGANVPIETGKTWNKYNAICQKIAIVLKGDSRTIAVVKPLCYLQ